MGRGINVSRLSSARLGLLLAMALTRRLAVRIGALLLPGAMLPAGPGRYRAVGLELLEPPASRSDDAARALAREALRSVEPLIRTYADDWLMFHPVWPEG